MQTLYYSIGEPKPTSTAMKELPNPPLFDQLRELLSMPVRHAATHGNMCRGQPCLGNRRGLAMALQPSSVLVLIGATAEQLYYAHLFTGVIGTGGMACQEYNHNNLSEITIDHVNAHPALKAGLMQFRDAVRRRRSWRRFSWHLTLLHRSHFQPQVRTPRKRMHALHCSGYVLCSRAMRDSCLCGYLRKKMR